MGPNRQQDALTLVITGAVGVRLGKISSQNRPIHGADDVAQSNLAGGAGQQMATSNSAFGSHQTGTLQS